MWTLVLSLVSVVVGSVLSYLLTNRKTRAEIVKLKAESSKVKTEEFLTVLEYWRKTALEFEKKVVELQQNIEFYQKEVDKLRKYNAQLIKKLDAYEKAGHASDSLHGHPTGERGNG